MMPCRSASQLSKRSSVSYSTPRWGLYSLGLSANHHRPLFVAEDADLSREVLQWIFYDLCDIAAIDQP